MEIVYKYPFSFLLLSHTVLPLSHAVLSPSYAVLLLFQAVYYLLLCWRQFGSDE
jgi:hypothetical protein